LCAQEGNCRYMTVYAADTITQDNWLYNIQGAYGILGYGQDSPFWN
jgi:hypothetical protein